MTWLGKVIGGAIGFALGGPLGAIAGAVFGHSFDGGPVELEKMEQPQLSQNEQTQMIFFVAVFSMLAKMANADGKIDDHESETIEKFMKKDLKLDSDSRKIALSIFNTALDSEETFERFAEQFYDHFQTQPGFLDFILDVLIRVSASDGAVTKEEEDLLLKAVRIFEYPSEAYLKLKAKYVDSGKDYHAVLGCDRQDSDDFVKGQYEKLAAEYHPEKIEARGLPDEFVLFATGKFQEIQEAYDKVRQERGLV